MSPDLEILYIYIFFGGGKFSCLGVLSSFGGSPVETDPSGLEREARAHCPFLRPLAVNFKWECMSTSCVEGGSLLRPLVFRSEELEDPLVNQVIGCICRGKPIESHNFGLVPSFMTTFV